MRSRDGGTRERRWRLRWRCFFFNATAEAADALIPSARANSAVSWVSHGADSKKGRSALRRESSPGAA
eukprot:294391-Pyramimonas_sp.AAC.1